MQHHRYAKGIALSLAISSSAYAQSTVTPAELQAYEAASAEAQRTGDPSRVLQLARAYCQRGVPNVCQYVAPLEQALSEYQNSRTARPAPVPGNGGYPAQPAPRPSPAPGSSVTVKPGLTKPELDRYEAARAAYTRTGDPRPVLPMMRDFCRRGIANTCATATALEGAVTQYENRLRQQAVSSTPSRSPQASTSVPRPSPVAPPDRSRVIAGNGQSAMHCAALVTLAKGDPSLAGGGRVIQNNCGTPIEIIWCYVDTECGPDRGALWTVGARRSWPVSATREIRWAACLGANTVAFEKGSAGTRYICSAPLGGPQPQARPGPPLRSGGN